MLWVSLVEEVSTKLDKYKSLISKALHLANILLKPSKHAKQINPIYYIYHLPFCFLQVNIKFKNSPKILEIQENIFMYNLSLAWSNTRNLKHATKVEHNVYMQATGVSCRQLHNMKI